MRWSARIREQKQIAVLPLAFPTGHTHREDTGLRDHDGVWNRINACPARQSISHCPVGSSGSAPNGRETWAREMGLVHG